MLDRVRQDYDFAWNATTFQLFDDEGRKKYSPYSFEIYLLFHYDSFRIPSTSATWPSRPLLPVNKTSIVSNQNGEKEPATKDVRFRFQP